MPIYEYRCASCGRVTELIQRVDEPAAAECGHCGGRLEKLFSAPSFQFKGSGWYATDYAPKRAAKEDAAEDKTSGKSEKTSAGSGSEAASKTSAAGEGAGT